MISRGSFRIEIVDDIGSLSYWICKVMDEDDLVRSYCIFSNSLAFYENSAIGRTPFPSGVDQWTTAMLAEDWIMSEAGLLIAPDGHSLGFRLVRSNDSKFTHDLGALLTISPAWVNRDAR